MIDKEYDFEFIYYRIMNAWKKAGFKNAAEFSKASGIPEGTISRWKKNNSTPDVRQLMKICNCCDVDIDFLLGRISTFKRDNQSIQDATGLSEIAIEALKEQKTLSNKTKDDSDGFIDGTTKLRLIDRFICECDVIASYIDFINEYHLFGHSTQGIDMDMLGIEIEIIHNSIADEYDRWKMFRNRFKSKYENNEISYTDNSIYQIYMYICNSQHIDVARFSIIREFDSIIDELTPPTNGDTV